MDQELLPRYWRPSDVARVVAARTFEDLRAISFGIIKKMPQPVGMVCGPITSGGRRSKEANIFVFKQEIERLSLKGLSIFSQMPLEEGIWRIQQNTNYYKGGDHTLEALYLPIFESGMVEILYFIQHWETSYGATWEHKQAMRLGIEIVYLK